MPVIMPNTDNVHVYIFLSKIVMSEASQFSVPFPLLSPSALLSSKAPLNQAKTIMNKYLKILTGLL